MVSSKRGKYGRSRTYDREITSTEFWIVGIKDFIFGFAFYVSLEIAIMQRSIRHPFTFLSTVFPDMCVVNPLAPLSSSLIFILQYCDCIG